MALCRKNILGRGNKYKTTAGRILERRAFREPAVPNRGRGAWGGLGRVPTYACGPTPSMSACSLQNVSFSLSPGKVTALVGPSGSGKSSCVNILENFYPLEGGRVLLDGKPIGSYDHKFLHQVVCGGPLLPSSALSLSKLFPREL